MTQTQTAVHLEIVVAAPLERAFAVFTERFGDIKPPEHNLLTAPIHWLRRPIVAAVHSAHSATYGDRAGRGP